MAKKKKKGGIRGELSVLAVATADREGAIVRVESGTILSRSKRYKSQRYDIHGSPLTKILSIRVPDNVPIPKDITDLEGCEVQITHRPEETVLDEDSGKFFYLYNPIQSFVGVKGKDGLLLVAEDAAKFMGPDIGLRLKKKKDEDEEEEEEKKKKKKKKSRLIMDLDALEDEEEGHRKKKKRRREEEDEDEEDDADDDEDEDEDDDEDEEEDEDDDDEETDRDKYVETLDKMPKKELEEIIEEYDLDIDPEATKDVEDLRKAIKEALGLND